MAIRHEEAVRQARRLLGTPYAQMDCIALIREVIRRSAGGDAQYRCEGVNWLWRSIGNAGKYRHLIWRQEGLHGARSGMLAFKRQGSDVHHVGLVTGEGTVIHASSAMGRTAETALDEGWALLGRHRLIEAGEEQQMADGERDGVVSTKGGRLNIRRTPGGEMIAQAENGARVTIEGGDGDWLLVAADGFRGYASAAYIREIRERALRLVIEDEAGNRYYPEGAFTVREAKD